MHSPSPSRPSRPLRGRDYRGSRQEPPTSVLPEGTLSAFCEFPTHLTTVLPHLEPTTRKVSSPTSTCPLRASRVGCYPASGLAVAATAATTTLRRRLRPSRASPARLSRCHRTCHGTCLKPSSAPRPAWSAMSTAPRRAASASIAPSLRSDHDACFDAHDVPLRGW